MAAVKKKSQEVPSRRRRMRFLPDQDALIVVIIDPLDEATRRTGLLRDESHEGCSGIFCGDSSSLTKGRAVAVVPGRAGAISAEIRWVKSLDENVTKVGFLYRI